MFRVPATSSGKKTAAAQISTQPSYLIGIDCRSPSSGTTILTIYDSSDSNTTGKLILAEVEVDAGMPVLNHEFSTPVAANSGIYVDVTGAATGSFIARYSL